jgi:hypothetical protein
LRTAAEADREMGTEEAGEKIGLAVGAGDVGVGAADKALDCDCDGRL